MNPLKRIKIFNSEPCPCGSGNPFIQCCKGKTAAIPVTKKPPEVQVMEAMRKSMKKCCLHPDSANCKGKIKNAHALQNNKIISLLAGTERHVYMLNAKRQPIIFSMDNGEPETLVEVYKTSANDATTETCFCDYHDNIAFGVLGKDDFLAADVDGGFGLVILNHAFFFWHSKNHLRINRG